ncbi:MAG: hypothetical protein CVV22_07735 [Ignavibacteriae bacterium HGW-Ignavibacteriae-1]|jgi:hypothetical protein|nr:MAG: hypothetical protein CVV22_07735 [Ignavibacteriae bacterium HGW-Ignavibacteriae-1]
MTVDNLIIIKGGAYSDVKKALRQWINLYSNDLEEDLTFQLFKNGKGSHIIQADKRLDNVSFYYLVNYLKYPEGIEYKIDIEGFTTGDEENELKNKNLLVYIFSTDKDYDNVFVTTSENENFKVDFNGRITETKEMKLYRLPGNLNFEAAESIIVQHQQDFLQERKTSIVNLEKRFKIIAVIILSALVLTYLIFKTHEDFMTINSYLAFAVWGWLVFDYKLLQVDKLYYGSVILGLVILLYGNILNNAFPNEPKTALVLCGATMPIFFLALQRPMRIIFRKIMKREPKMERPTPSVADFIYSFILFLLSITIPMYIYLV